MSNLAELPRTWSLDSYFPSFDGPEFRAFKQALAADLAARLAEASAAPALAATSADTWARLFAAFESIGSRLGHLSSYLGNLASADTNHSGAKRELAQLAAVGASLTKFRNEFIRAFGAAPDAEWSAFLARADLASAAFTLDRLRAEARHRMSGTEEALAADLGVDGISAFGRLYDNLTGQLTFEMTWPDGRRETIPMAQRRALMAHTDRAVRAAAFAGGNVVWHAHGETFAAALNAIAGTRHTLYGRRGLDGFLAQPYFDAAISAATVDAMFRAIMANLELPRRALRLGAKLQGTPALAYYDLEAPRPLDPVPPLSWEAAVKLVDSAFSTAYPDLGDYYRGMLEKRWIESEKRPHKRSGAYCTGSALTGEQRVFMTYADTMHDANTLAHEVGHAWHSHVLKDLRPFAQDYPMTLAETASTFAEKILLHGLLQDTGLTAAQRAFLLDQECGNAASYLLNIPMRYEFEKAFYTRRRDGELSVAELDALMVETQRRVYGDTITEGDEDPCFWASKLHFFITEISFYNFPYTFGYLLSQALFNAFKKEGPSFLPRYEAFLRATGIATCEDAVRATLGWDLTSEKFWADTIQTIAQPIEEFAAVVAARTGTAAP